MLKKILSIIIICTFLLNQIAFASEELSACLGVSSAFSELRTKVAEALFGETDAMSAGRSAASVPFLMHLIADVLVTEQIEGKSLAID